jgi:hypothetical protein
MMEAHEIAKVATDLLATGDHDEKVDFPNGHGISIIRHQYSYGGSRGLFEIAGRTQGELDLGLIGETDGGVIGWLTPLEVLEHMKNISELPSAIEG